MVLWNFETLVHCVVMQSIKFIGNESNSKLHIKITIYPLEVNIEISFGLLSLFMRVLWCNVDL